MNDSIEKRRHRAMWDSYMRPSPIYAEFKAKAEAQELERAFAPCVGCTTPNCCGALGECARTFDGQARHRELCREYVHGPKRIEPNVGGTCQLKSGGPAMTIATVEITKRLDATNDGNGSNRVTNIGCVWHGEAGELHAEKLSLMLVDVLS